MTLQRGKQIAGADRNRRRRGSAMLETALIFMGFTVMLIGIVDFGQFLFIHNALTERARSSLRYGEVKYFNTGYDPDGIRNMVLYNQPTPPVGINPPRYMNLDPSMVLVSHPDAGTADERIVLQITNYPYQILSPYIAGTYYGPNIVVTAPLGQN